MEIQSTLTNRSGQVLKVMYRDAKSTKDFEDRKMTVVHAYCFYKDKLVVVYSDIKGYWSLPGGGVEAGESVTQAIQREVKEETNMRVLKQSLLGFQDIFEPQRVVSQTRSVCLVEPIGAFEKDPDGDVTKIKLIEPGDYKQYFNWGQVGEHLMKRALQLKAQMDTEMV